MNKLNKKYGIVFWITGLSGSGKTTLAKEIQKEIIKLYGPTILVNGDNIRSIFEIKSYEKRARLKLAKNYTKFCKFITKQKINILFTAVALFNEVHKENRKILPNYIEIFIKSDIKKLIKKKKKIFYINKTDNVWGLDIRPEFPKKPHIIINNNNLSKNIKCLKKNLIKKIKVIL